MKKQVLGWMLDLCINGRRESLLLCHNYLTMYKCKITKHTLASKDNYLIYLNICYWHPQRNNIMEKVLTTEI